MRMVMIANKKPVHYGWGRDCERRNIRCFGTSCSTFSCFLVRRYFLFALGPENYIDTPA